MTLFIINYVIIATFVVACTTGIGCFFWSVFFLIKMGFQFVDPVDAFSVRTLWNPLNALFSPALLSLEGRRSRRFLFMGALGFTLSIAIALGVAGLAWLVK